MKIRAKQSKVIFTGDTYQVLVFKTIEGYEKSSFTACGNLPKLTSREEIVLEGEFKNNGRFGEQFHVETWKRPVPDTKEQLVTFFSSALFVGVGKKMAERIVEKLGKNSIKQISKDGSKTLKEVDGIKEEMAEKIAETVQRTFVLNELIELYAPFGIASEILLKAHVILGLRINELHDNPYLLSQYSLLHFSTADDIGRKMGILPHSFNRLETFIKLSLVEFISKQGHCYLDEKEFIQKCLVLLNQKVILDEDKVYESTFFQALELSKFSYLENGKVYPTKLYFAEKDTAEMIHGLTLGDSNYEFRKVQVAIHQFELEEKILLSEEQKKTIHELLSNNVLILTGGPGTGKTFTINGVLKVYLRLFPNAKVSLAAPTGRAAKKLGEVTGMGSHAQTIHRMLGIGYLGPDRPQFDLENQLPFNLIVVDEFSMVDIKLASHLLKAIEKGTKLLIVGDPDQLPSVGAGNVLKDLLEAGIPSVRLNQIFRQAQNSSIVKNAHRINSGEQVDFTNSQDHFFIESENSLRTAQLVVQSVERFMTKGISLQDMMVLAPMKKGPAGVENLNEMIRERINPATSKKKEISYLYQTYREGDKVMYTRNNRDLDVYNGDTGTIKSIKQSEKIMLVEIDGNLVEFDKDEWKYLQLAYAMTIHRHKVDKRRLL
jgi:exodeoxyribonuclease V alpha subunit